ncbi:hypothetical protein SAMN05660368_03530 [Marvinbryantia formatexigens]|nr:hypothetical protein SAMN05660368_03530 [Marvinbryantia formatexigens]
MKKTAVFKSMMARRICLALALAAVLTVPVKARNIGGKCVQNVPQRCFHGL